MIKRWLPRWCVVAMSLPVVFAEARAGGGAIPVEVNLPDLAQKGWTYQVTLPPADGAPEGSLLTVLSWHYDLAPTGPVASAWLCAPAECVSLNMARGSTDAFAGLPVSTQLSLRFILPGRGMLKRPVQGGTAQVFINYRLNDQ